MPRDRIHGAQHARVCDPAAADGFFDHLRSRLKKVVHRDLPEYHTIAVNAVASLMYSNGYGGNRPLAFGRLLAVGAGGVL